METVGNAQWEAHIYSEPAETETRTEEVRAHLSHPLMCEQGHYWLTYIPWPRRSICCSTSAHLLCWKPKSPGVSCVCHCMVTGWWYHAFLCRSLPFIAGFKTSHCLLFLCIHPSLLFLSYGICYLFPSVSKFKHKTSSPNRDGHVLMAGSVVFSPASLWAVMLFICIFIFLNSAK